jgi:diguanylate cyclase (GGDEF)-like protein
LDHELDRAVRTARSAGTPLIVVMFDLDHFKAYNDLAGHQAGDHLLQSVARAWSALIPEGAFLARYGGEEFALILPGQEAPGARSLLDRLRRAMPSECSVSIGFAQLADGETGLAALNRADRALYAAKAAGRDRVVSAEDADSAG